VSKEKRVSRTSLPPNVKDTLDFFVDKGIINYSSWDECYFYLSKDNDLIILDFALDELFKSEKDAII
jgi:hypothetical protein